MITLARATNRPLTPIPDALDGHTHWQYGTEEHSSSRRRILGSVMFTATSDSGLNVFIRHLFLDGSSQWVIGKNVTQKANILQIGKNALQFIVDDVTEHISMTNLEFLSYISLTAFAPGYD